MSKKILLVDDSKTQLDALRLRFTKKGYEAEVAENALDGYRKIFTFVPDLIISDVLMPNLDGYQFCRLLKNNSTTRDIPFVLLSVLDRNLDKFWGNKAGAQACLSKTTDFDELLKTIDKLIDEHKLSDDYKEQIASFQMEDSSVDAQLNRILNELLMQSIFLNEFRNLAEYYNHEKVLIEKCFELFSTFMEYDAAGIFFNAQGKDSKKILYFDFKNNSISQIVAEKLKRDFFTKLPKINAFDSNNFVHEIINQDETSENKILSPSAIKSSCILPMMFEDQLLGAVCFFSKLDIDYPKFQFYDSLKQELMVLFKMKSLYSKVEFLSITDELTTLYNRRYFDYNIEREFARAKRYKNHLSIALLDIDFFKQVNDTYGHQYGDYVLKEVSKMLKDSFRKTDMVYRYGGEELMVIMPETPLENAIIPLERFREKIANHEFIYNEVQIKLTVSVGIGAMKEDYKEFKELVESADKALYLAKQTGRNKVVIYNEKFGSIK